MNLLDRDAFVTIDNNYVLYDKVYECLDGIAIKTESVTGLEIITFVVSVSELIAIILSMPIIQEAFRNGHIIVMIGGIKFNDSVRKIINEINKDPKLLEAAKAAYIDDKIKVEGNVKAVQSFRAKLQLVIEHMEKDQ